MEKAQIRFAFHCEACAENSLRVMRLKGTESLGRAYEFVLDLAGQAVSPQDMLQAQAGLELRTGSRILRYNGFISAIEERGISHGTSRYRVTLAHDLAQLAFSTTNTLFVETPVSEIITQVLQGISSPRKLDFALKLTAKHPVRELVCRYRENNLHFLQRILEQSGLYYFFQEADSPTAPNRILFTDSPQAHPQPDRQQTFAWHEAAGLSYQPTENVIQSFELRQQRTVEQVLADDYNPVHPALLLSGQASIKARPQCPGSKERFYGGAFSQEQARELAAVRAQALACHAKMYAGALGAPLLRSGLAFKLTNHPLTAWNADYLITGVRHEGTQPADAPGAPDQTADTTYRAVFTAIPANQPFKLLWNTPKPRISGVLPARIQAAGSGAYAEVDANGCYKLLLPFGAQESETPVKAGVRMLQPYGGPDCGLHFPLHKNTEVLVAFLQGDPDRPVIVGAVPNAGAPSMVTAGDPAAHCIRTSSGNLFRAHDAAANNHILLASPPGDSSILIGKQPKDLEAHHNKRTKSALHKKINEAQGTAPDTLKALLCRNPHLAAILNEPDDGNNHNP